MNQSFLKLLIFDLGKVLVDFDFSIAIRNLEKFGVLNPLKVFSLFRDSKLSQGWDKGLLEPEKFFEILRKELELKIQMDEFIPIWNNIFTEKKEMIEIVTSLHKKYPIVVLSNTNPWHASYLREHCFWLNELNGFIASCDVHLLKPDPELFKLVLKNYSVKAKETFFVDDLKENVVAAQSLGMEAVLFKELNQFNSDLKQRSILIPA